MSNRRTTVAGSVLGLICALILSSIPANAVEQKGKLTEEFHQTYPLSANGTVSLHNINGAVRIAAWDRNEVKVDAVKTAQSKERLDEAKIVVDAKADSVTIKTEYPRNTNTWSDRDRHDNPASVEYTVTVPRTARLRDVELVNGNLTIDGVRGDVEASSVNGQVNAKGLVGRVKLSAVNGELNAAFENVGSQRIELDCVNGSLGVTLPSDVQALVQASTVNGSIRNDYNLPVSKGRFVGRDLKGQLGDGGGATIKLSNVNGRIEIRHANDGKALSKATNLLRDARAGEEQL